MKKGQICEGVIQRVDFPNKGMVYVPEEDRYVIVKNGIPGQKVRFAVNKFKKGNAEGRLLEVLEQSPLETREPVCRIFQRTGVRDLPGLRRLYVSDHALRGAAEDEGRPDPPDHG